MSFLFSLLIPYVSSQRPICEGLHEGTPINGTSVDVPSKENYTTEVETLDIPSVFQDLYTLFKDYYECWPPDSFNGESNYGGLFIRLSWHCSGTFRQDGKGGCAGGRQRFYPEASWPDNTNLDKARSLLSGIKNKYGDALSWGDLMVFAGSAAIYHMGGPIGNQVCAGRIDEPNGENSYPLIDDTSCPAPGNCELPLGQSTIGLIYVNPAGINGTGIHNQQTAARIRDVFGRMNMNDSETVALIGGGHTFGKAHGACELGAGLPPSESPDNPWPGLCNNGIFTSGFEGAWTSTPFKWSKQFFTQLVNDEYVPVLSKGGSPQFENTRTHLMMLATDMALMDDEIYASIARDFAENEENFRIAFGAAWQKLVTDGEEWIDNPKCIDVQLLVDNNETATYEQPSWVAPILAVSVIVLVLFIVICVARDCCDKSLNKQSGMQRLISDDKY